MKKVTIKCISEDNKYYEQEIQAKRIVCERCDGEGRHTNPNIDDKGLTSEDIDELGGSEFMEAYMSGRYDIVCEECCGNKVIDVPDYEVLEGTEILKDHQRYLEEESRAHWEEYYERRVGA